MTQAPGAGAGSGAGVEAVRVATAAPYDVLVGRGLLAEVPRLLADLLPGVRRVALVHPEPLADRAAALSDAVTDALDDVTVLPLAVPDGEVAKTVATAERCWERLGEAGFTRSDAVLTLGGGATTDLGGFVAACWLRGVAVVHVPTTLLAMVDAAVGGKTGVNTGAGKNLVGAFHEPAAVVCDLDLLTTLPRPELVAGMAEVVKCGFVADPGILEIAEADPGAALDPSGDVLAELVLRAVRVKAHVVAGDLRETGGAGGHPGREALNYGHTLAHAVERTSDYTVRHGEAVAIGSVFVAEVARRSGLLADDVADRHAAVLAGLGLPTTYDAASFDDLLAVMRVDKKARGASLRLVVLDDVGSPRILTDPDPAVLAEAYAALGGPR
ncbi:3-dehydroquinate synthase [Nocardioides sp. CFH 31398]|uniref:3-dehydroquinate synthase n=1 Tax=Nocardioides sp. CFH 31398 TaxID=2919579 RepID=UPI001F0619F6|nr:3-dehydroquinate synthase [Nocardioides sp. CFH 31398]MCH1867403.1 3-dehydroquinate synthase [Nocardioides sp. CFH 31398]MCH1868600.1 3-dehydroquinate synthase [Nocardioides sp. CFH 31398]